MQYHVTQSKLSRRTVVLHFYVDHLYFDTQMTEKYSTAMCQYQTDPGSSRVSALHFPSLNKKDDLRTHFNYKSCFMIFHDWFFWRTFVFLCINKITYSFLLPSAWTGKSHRLHHLCMAHVAWVTKPALCYLWILGLHAISFFIHCGFTLDSHSSFFNGSLLLSESIHFCFQILTWSKSWSADFLHWKKKQAGIGMTNHCRYQFTLG